MELLEWLLPHVRRPGPDDEDEVTDREPRVRGDRGGGEGLPHQPLSRQLRDVPLGRLVRLHSLVRDRAEVEDEDSDPGGGLLGQQVPNQHGGGGALCGGRVSGGRGLERLEQVGILLRVLRDGHEVTEPDLLTASAAVRR